MCKMCIHIRGGNLCDFFVRNILKIQNANIYKKIVKKLIFILIINN